MNPATNKIHSGVPIPWAFMSSFSRVISFEQSWTILEFIFVSEVLEGVQLSKCRGEIHYRVGSRTSVLAALIVAVSFPQMCEWTSLPHVHWPMYRCWYTFFVAIISRREIRGLPSEVLIHHPLSMISRCFTNITVTQTVLISCKLIFS